MTSITKEIWKLIQNDVIIRRSLEKKIASYKKLAVYFMREYKISSSTDAIISAIRRYNEQMPLEAKYEKARKIIAKSGDIRITTNIVSIALEKKREVQELLEKVFSLVHYEKGELLIINQGEQSIKLILNKKNQEAVSTIFPKNAVLSIEENLAQINIQLDDEATKTPGIVSILSTELMLHDINFVETMSCVPEMLFFVDQKDVVKSYDIIFQLCNPTQ